MLRRLSYPSGV